VRPASLIRPSVPSTDLGAKRAEELELSCARLGIDPPVRLRFHDSARKERQRHDDPHALANVDMLDVESAIRAIIADVKPHVIVTFEPHGGYYHPDHVAIPARDHGSLLRQRRFGRGRAGASFLWLDAPRRVRTVRGGEPGPGRDRRPQSGPVLDVAGDGRRVIRRAPYLDRKLSALAAHQSAFGITTEMLQNPVNGAAQLLNAFRPVFEREVYLLGGARGPIGQWPMRDFFAGLAVHVEAGPERNESPASAPI
jgi:N-acetyl-1-D-myo-inositol-2-amino-2-deoxy-alpha-D-glucopyranoside deacetylase